MAPIELRAATDGEILSLPLVELEPKHILRQRTIFKLQMYLAKRRGTYQIKIGDANSCVSAVTAVIITAPTAAVAIGSAVKAYTMAAIWLRNSN
jgi:hypothetical protein